MEEADTIKFVKICRFCLSQDEEYLISIAEAPDFALTIQDVARFTGIDINETNKAIYAMCLDCTENLKDTASFRNTCLDNDVIFHELYEAMVSSVKEIYGDTVEYLDSDFQEDEQDKLDNVDEEIEMVKKDEANVMNLQHGEVEIVEEVELLEEVEMVEAVEKEEIVEKVETAEKVKTAEKVEKVETVETVGRVEKVFVKAENAKGNKKHKNGENYKEDEEEEADGLCLVEFDDCMIEVDLRKALETSNNGPESVVPHKKAHPRASFSCSAQEPRSIWQQLNSLLKQSSVPSQESSTVSQESMSLTQQSSFFRPESKSLWQRLSTVLEPTRAQLPKLKPSEEEVLDDNYDPFSYSANYIDIGEPLESDHGATYVDESSDGHYDRKGRKKKKRFVKRKGGIPKPIEHDTELGPLFSPKPEEPKFGVFKVTARTKRRLHLCHECGAYTAHINSHVTNHLTEPVVPCPHCPKMFKQRYPLLNHIKQVHAKQVCKTCEICGKGFIHHKTYRYHMLDHASAGKRFECEHCGVSFSNHIYLRDHFNRMHNILRSKHFTDPGSS